MSAVLTRLFSAWDRANIRYLVLRNYELLPEHTENDIDILLDPAQLHPARKLLEQAARQEGWTIHNLGHFSCTALFLYNLQTLEQIHLDLMCGAKWYSFFFADHSLMLESRLPHKNFFRPAPVHETAVLLLTRLLYGGRVKEKYRETIRRSASDSRHELTEVLSPWLGGSLSRRIVEHAAAGQWEAIEAQAAMVRINVLLANLRHPLRLVRSMVSDVDRLVRRWRSSPGLSVVFSGPDGCGKSSVAGGLKVRLLKTFYPERTIHCHWKPVPQRGTTPPAEDPHGQPPRNQIISLLYFGYHYAAFIFGWWRYIKPVLFRNGFAVIDRYYYDFFVDQRRYRLSLPPWIVRLGFIFIKKPDLVFCLDADPEILQARKQEVSFEECQRQREAYRALVQKLPNGHVIDASQPLADVVRDVQAAVLNYMAARTAGRMAVMEWCYRKGSTR
ncbi:MAG: hypothetical protein WC959_04440 [Kiritimatiellales bacterium]